MQSTKAREAVPGGPRLDEEDADWQSVRCLRVYFQITYAAIGEEVHCNYCRSAGRQQCRLMSARSRRECKIATCGQFIEIGICRRSRCKFGVRHRRQEERTHIHCVDHYRASLHSLGGSSSNLRKRCVFSFGSEGTFALRGGGLREDARAVAWSDRSELRMQSCHRYVVHSDGICRRNQANMFCSWCEQSLQ